MKVLERAKTPEGFDIQIEDWTEDYSCFNTLSIGAYPRSERIPKSRTSYVTAGETFRVSINREFKNNEEVRKAFEELKQGIKTVKDFASQFWDLWHIEML